MSLSPPSPMALPQLDLAACRPLDPDATLGTLESPFGRLPLVAVDIEARIVGLDASVTLTQRFVNRTEQAVEATYVFPLPARAAVFDFVADLAGRRVHGVLAERGAARETYEQAIARGDRAALVEQDRPEVFSATVGNLRPGEEAEIRLDLVQPLAWDAGEATFRFPLVVAPRYVPGTPIDAEPSGTGTAPDTDAVPDASRVTPPVLLPGQPEPVALSLEVTIDPAGLDATTPACSHPAEAAGAAGGASPAASEGAPGGSQGVSGGAVGAGPAAEPAGPLAVRLLPGARMDRDFVLRFAVSDAGGAAVAATAVAVPDNPEAAGSAATVEVTAVAPLAPGSPPRDVVVLLDRSGSMSGWKMAVARRAAARLVDGLDASDRVAVIGFDHVCEVPGLRGAPQPLAGPPPLASATDAHRWEVVSFLARLDARGGTELAQAIVAGLDALRAAPTVEPPVGATPGPAGAAVVAGERRRVLLVVTDGQVADEDRLVRLLARRAAGVEVHTVGIDSAVNAGLLERLAQGHGGRCELVDTEARLDAALDAVRRRLGQPAWTDIALRLDGAAGVVAEDDSLAPSGSTAVFPGSPQRFAWRVELPGGVDATNALAGASVVLTARTGAGEPVERRLPVRVRPGSAARVLWARARLADLEDRYVAGSDPGLEARIVALSLRHGVLSRFTAFVAVAESEPGEDTDSPGPLVHLDQPVSWPSGWEMPAGPMRMASVAPDALFLASPAPDAAFGMAAAPVHVSPPVAPAPPPSPAGPGPRPKTRTSPRGRREFWKDAAGGSAADAVPVPPPPPPLPADLADALVALRAQLTRVVGEEPSGSPAWAVLAAEAERLADALSAADGGFASLADRLRAAARLARTVGAADAEAYRALLELAPYVDADDRWLP